VHRIAAKTPKSFGFALGGYVPFKSQAQRRKFAQLLVEGKISNQTFEEWNRETGAANLPERVKPKTNGRPETKTKAKRKAKVNRKSK
jgi:hypothetical protein